MTIDNKTLGIAIAALLAGGGAVAAYNASKSEPAPAQQYVTAAPQTTGNLQAGFQPTQSDTARSADVAGEAPAAGGTVEAFAPITNVHKVTASNARYASVLGVQPVTRTIAQNSPRQECHDVAVQQRLPERDGNVGGTVLGAVIGGLAGHQVGGGKGRDLATVGGAVAGGFIGNRIDRNHVGGRVVNTTQQQCNTVNDRTTSEKVVGYDVTFRNPDGSVGMKRMGSRPGSRIPLGSAKETVGYDVTYDYQGKERTVRLDERPTVTRFPVVDGRVVTRI